MIVELGIVGTVLLFIVGCILAAAIRINKEWEEAIILRLGRYKTNKGPGLFLLTPIIETAIRRDKRVRTLDIKRQNVITKDNISVGIDAVVFMQVVDTKKSILNIKDYEHSVMQCAQTTLRDVIGAVELDELLTSRDRIASDVKKIVDKSVETWGVDIKSVELQDIELPEDMKRVMATQAEAEREKRAVIIKSEGELIASKNLREAAEEMEKSPMAYQLRLLTTINDVSKDQSNTIFFAFPMEGLDSKALTMGAGAALTLNQKNKKK